MEDKFEKALSDAVRAIESVSRAIFEYFKNLDLKNLGLKRYKPMKMRKRNRGVRKWNIKS